MELTGKCREDFIDYLLNGIIDFSYRYNYFMNLHPTMQYGVYLDFFDSVGIHVMTNMFSIKEDIASEFIGQVETIELIWNTIQETRQQARAAAIEKADEIYNSKG
tara:strand:- start:225 stop:539 length:315 start_codon:yes stop_codon:yes gene_type:complete